MKQKIKLIAFLACCGIMITASLIAGRGAYKHCDKCHFDITKQHNQTNILTGLYEPYPAGIKP